MEIKTFPLRLPVDLREWVLAEAERNKRSMTKQICFVLEKERDHQARKRQEVSA